MDKTAKTRFPIHNLLAERWSPLSFAARAVDKEILGSLLEAARWAPSCYNEQPWRFCVAMRADEVAFEKLSACLVAGNAWAKRAPVLMLSIAKLEFTLNEKPNRHAYHDVGLAVQNMVIQAESMGLRVHQMGGFDVDLARTSLGIPAGYDAVAMIAIGYPGDPMSLPEAHAAREREPRARKELDELAFGASWGATLGFDR